MATWIFYVFSITTLYIIVNSSTNEGFLTCSNGCSLTNRKITAEDSTHVMFTYFIDNAQFTSVTILYDGKTVLTASTATVLPSTNRDSRFHVSNTNVMNDVGKYSFNFIFKNVKFGDNNKKFMLRVNVNGNVFSYNLTFEVKGGPRQCAPLKGTYTIEEGHHDDVLWMLCGNPPPTVTANIEGRYYEVIRTASDEHTFIYTIKLRNMVRQQCGKKLHLEASGYRKLTRSIDVIVDFIPTRVHNFDAKYDTLQDCSTLTWNSVEAGDCHVKYVLKYDNEYDSFPGIYEDTSLLTYTKCGTDIGYNFSIKAVVNGRDGRYSEQIVRTGTGKVIAGNGNGFPWYYILIIVAVIIIVFFCIILFIQRTKNKEDNTKGIEKANAIEIYAEVTRKKREAKATDNKGFRGEEKADSEKSSTQLVKVTKKKKKGSKEIPIEENIPNGSKIFDNEETRARTEKSIKPATDEASFRVTFLNIDQAPVKLFWKDYNGNEKFCHKINPGREHHVIAFTDYSYIARDHRTNKLVYFKNDNKYDIMFKGTEFGADKGEVNNIIITSEPEMDIPNGLVNHQYQNDDTDTDIDSNDDISPDNSVYAEVSPERTTIFSTFQPDPVDENPGKPSTPILQHDLPPIQENAEII